MIKSILYLVIVLFAFSVVSLKAQWPEPKAPAISEADGYVVIPNAAVPLEKNHIYRAVFDATKFPKDFKDLLPAINNAGAELNAFEVTGVPHKNIKFAIVFHGPAVDGLLDDIHYKAKYGINNPNLVVLAKLKKLEVELFVCGQNLALDNIDPKTLTPDITIANDSLIVLIKYQNSGYALLSF